MLMNKILLFFFFLICSITLKAQFSKLDTLFNNMAVANRFMGSVAIAKNGKIVYEKQTGYIDVDSKISPDRESKYRIGSITKMFTSALVLKAVEDKKLFLEDKLVNFFPSVQKAEKITIKNLLGHRSGIHNFTDNSNYFDWDNSPITPSALIDTIVKGGLDFEPGARSEYSNSNFVLLTLILEKVYNKSYKEILAEKITGPLKLSNTYVASDADIKRNESYSYSFMDGSWKKASQTDMSIPLGAGCIVSTPGDLVKFAQSLFGGKIISESSLNLMEETIDGYGLGLFKIPFYEHTGFGHSGAIDEFTSILYHFADSNITVVILSNGKSYSNNAISISMLSAVYNRDYDVPSFKTYYIPKEDLEKYGGTYSSKELPIKIKIVMEGDQLYGQATGQAKFPLTPVESDKFTFDEVGLVLLFDPAGKKMILKQGGREYNFERE